MAYGLSQGITPRKYAIRWLVFALCTSFVGGIIAWITQDQDWASRFGALVVVIGLIAITHMVQTFGRESGEFDDPYHIAASFAAMEKGHEQFASSEDDLRRNKKIMSEFDRSAWAVKLELGIIGFGTLQWGFGDLIVDLVGIT